MKIIKGLLIGIIFLSISLAICLFFLLQPSGKVDDFKAYQPQLHSAPQLPHQGLNVHFFGVSTLLFDDGKEQILIDGFFSRATLAHVLSSKISGDLAKLIQIKNQYDLKRAHAVLVSHSHYDHALDLPNLTEILPHLNVVGSPTTLNIARANSHLNEARLHLAKAWQTQQFGKFTITPIPSAHTPPTAINNDLGEEITHPFQLPAKFSEFKEGGSYDYLIEYQKHRILVKASTGFIPNQLKNLHVDTLFLGIAQLSKQSPAYQQHYLAETLETLKPKVVIPIHWDNFFQPLDQPLQFLPYIADNSPKSLNILIRQAEKQGTQVVLLTHTTAYPLTSQAP